MQTKILLNSKTSKQAVNTKSNVNVGLSAKSRVLPKDVLSDKLSLLDLYNAERDGCTKFRLLFNVNPICSNVLFNKRSEIVKNEGSSAVTVLVNNVEGATKSPINTTKLTYLQGIRDTEYTDSEIGGYTYHCGTDIFNNHMLRVNDFIHINKIGVNGDKTVFNTIFDYQRDKNGKRITESLTDGAGSMKDVEIHLYNQNNILTLYNAYSQRLTEKDGWYGFTNPGFIEIANDADDEKYINHLMNANKACEFIDMYPDRSLFSFIPKVNKYRHRLEYNWDYCLTYPYENDYAKFNEINKNTFNALKVIDSGTTSTNMGTEMFMLKTLMKHNLEAGDYVRFFFEFNRGGRVYTASASTTTKVSVVGMQNGDDKEHIFNVKYTDFLSALPAQVYSATPSTIMDGLISIYVKKNDGTLDCSYYFRKFKKIKKVSMNNTMVDYNSSINKAAFAENIYGDRIAQILYNEDVDIDGLTDNRGRELSEIYLTFVKANRGHEKWYTYSGGNDASTTINSEDVEFSHCFGKVTSGLDLPTGVVDYNVRRIHNVDFESISENYIEATSGIYSGVTYSGNVLEDDIVISGDTFYGDVVEYNPIKYQETTIEDVCHRFNTQQRETTNSAYYDLYYDEMIYDDEDAALSNTAFTISATTISRSQDISDMTYKPVAGNIDPEGYFYKPHNKIVLREESDTLSSMYGRVINSTGVTINRSESVIEIALNLKYGEAVDDKVIFYDKANNKILWTIIKYISSDGLLIKVNADDDIIELIEGGRDGYDIVEAGGSTPRYAQYLPSLRKFVWKELLCYSQLTEGSENYDIPFANGKLYIERNINFFLRRQDAFGNEGLSMPEKKALSGGHKFLSPLKSYRKMGEVLDDEIEELKYEHDTLNTLCY